MKTSELIKDYLAAKRAHGTRLRSGERALYQFARETGDRPLAAYLKRRCCASMPQGSSSAFFASREGHRLNYPRGVTLFQRVRAHAGIGCPPGASRPPRLHDLRHTAAVHRVLTWYQQGHDVQQLLPKLATYLGHASVASTQRYLQMTPELLLAARMRFAAYAETVEDEVTDHA